MNAGSNNVATSHMVRRVIGDFENCHEPLLPIFLISGESGTVKGKHMIHLRYPA